MYGRSAAGPVSVRRDANEPADCAHEKDLQKEAFRRAAEGIRTLDLLHGKQLVGLGARAECPCKWATSAARGGAADASDFTAKSREFPD
jgi:hypothetical protein